MKFKLTLLALGASLLTAMPAWTMEKLEGATDLKVKPSLLGSRPPKIEKTIEAEFEEIRKRPQGKDYWHFNGDTEYSLLCPAKHLMWALIEKATEEQKDIYILDVGAGDFTWGRSAIEFCIENKVTYKGKNLDVHVISVTGENYEGIRSDEKINGNIKFTHHKIDCFKIENLDEELKKRGFDLRFDFILSSYTFIHLTDPVGTLLRAHDILKFGGIISMHGFQITYLLNYDNLRDNIIQFLVDTREPFLFNDGLDSGLGEFLLKKTISTEDLLSGYTYSGGTSSIEIGHAACHEVATVEKKTPFLDWGKLNSPYDDPSSIFGDKKLYEEIVEYVGDQKTFGAKWKDCYSWKSLYK